MAENVDRVLETLRALMRVEELAGTPQDDLAGALLELGAEITLQQYGTAQTAELLHRLAAVLEPK